MRGQLTSTTARSSKEVVAPCLVALGDITPSQTSTPSPSQDPLLQRKYRELIRKHLGKLLDKLFADFTGLHFHVTWSPPPPHQWDAETLPTGCSTCCRLSGSPLRPGCKTCGPRQLIHTLMDVQVAFPTWRNQRMWQPPRQLREMGLPLPNRDASRQQTEHLRLVAGVTHHGELKRAKVSSPSRTSSNRNAFAGHPFSIRP
jgi:hypothetical protein